MIKLNYQLLFLQTLLVIPKEMDNDELLTMRYLQRQKEVIYPIVDEYGGKVLKEIGDGLLIAFDSAIQAVRWSVKIQSKLKGEEFKIRAAYSIGVSFFFLFL